MENLHRNDCKRAVIIGSGFSSLASAAFLAQGGYEVTVLEKNEQIGGRASLWEKDGFRFDMGPSWYWMPDIFERFFSYFDKKPTDYYQLEKLSPAYRVFFGKDDFVDIADNPEEIISTFENIEKGAGKALRDFLAEAGENYRVAMQDLVWQPGLSPMELASWETAKRLNLFLTTVAAQVRKKISNPKLRSILEFPVLFLGAKPANTPAFYNFMNYADFGLGTWYPKGGFNAVANGMAKLAEEMGVKFITNEEVIKITTENGLATAVQTDAKIYPADVVISGADYAHTDKILQENANYSEDYWKKKTFAPSALLYYLALDEPVEGMAHHNLFFDTDFSAHAHEIYDEQVFPKEPLFYANFSSKTDESLSPKGKEVGFILIPVAVDLEDTPEIREYYFNLVMERIEQITAQDLRKKVLFRRDFGPNAFRERYYSCRGNAYGLANTLLQTSVLRPRVKNKKLKNFFYTGQLTVPGPGVPPAIISGKVVTDLILNESK